MDAIKDDDKGVSVHGIRFSNLRFADDIDLIDEDEQRLEHTLHTLNEECKRYGLFINYDKTKTMVFGEKDIAKKIAVDGIQLDNVEKFTYL